MWLTRYVRDLGTRYPLCRPPARGPPGIRRAWDCDPRSWHWRHDSHLQRGPCRRASSASAATTRADRCRVPGLQGARRKRLRRQFRRCAGGDDVVRGNDGDSVFELQPVARGNGGTGHRRADDRGVLHRLRRAAGVRSRVHRRRGSAGSRAGRRPEPSALDATLAADPAIVGQDVRLGGQPFVSSA